MSINCPYGELQKKGTRNWIHCNKMNKMCMFQRYCTKERSVVFSTGATNCKLRNNG